MGNFNSSKIVKKMKALSGLLVLSVMLIFSSCKKDEETSPETPAPSSPVYSNYSKMAVGNYWVYQRYSMDTNEVMTPTVIDSCYVSGDTVINGKTYFVYNEPSVGGGNHVRYLRDSLHYILDLNKIIFSSQSFNTIFDSGYNVIDPINDTVCRYESKMTNMNMVVNVSAGTFTTHTFLTNYYMYPAYSSAGSVRYIYSRRAKNIGVVEESLPFFANSPNYEIRHLLRYHVN
jgi:hypothetical protein